ncbi:FMN reductase [Microvirga lotononidis]|uniref:FMN reductase, MsuE subfamily n=1 Tax=Microvirga lotononidis TaxID=864069 RepID=I4Z1A2_9HYPH|nr:FMN reductase [Microvirga lotononidis]EIM29994.1 FMN reductase, MsuE subfamily [Microvirga lotononidis]WQO32066.1 FMN reductase [Microvirga lotononidis]
MSTIHIVGFSGNLHRPSKTRSLVETVGAAVVADRPYRFDLFDVVDAAPGLGSATSRQELSLPSKRVIDAIEQADALIIGSPVYKGAYTGLFKHVFDLVDPLALTGKPVLITATGGGPRHALVVEHVLRPLFGFFAALTVPTAVYASDADFKDGKLNDSGIQGRANEAAAQLVRLIGDSSEGTRADWAPSLDTRRSVRAAV